MYGLALSYLKNQHDAEDVTQDAFVRAWENAHQYRPQGTPLAWLLTIARNLALMKLRERGRTQDMALEDWERLAAENPMVTVEDRQVLDAALTALADDERQIVLLHAVTRLEAQGDCRPAGAAPVHGAVQVPPRAPETKDEAGRRGCPVTDQELEQRLRTALEHACSPTIWRRSSSRCEPRRGNVIP